MNTVRGYGSPGMWCIFTGRGTPPFHNFGALDQIRRTTIMNELKLNLRL